MKRPLIITLLFILIIVGSGYVWFKQVYPTISPSHAIRSIITQDSGTFEFKLNGDIVVHTQNCEDPWVGGIYHQHAEPNWRSTVLEGVNAKVDNVERISSQFLRINGQVYDAYSAEFQRLGISRTHNIENNINEEGFKVVDKDEQYFTDGENYYFYENYPTFRACFSSSNKSTSIPQIQIPDYKSDLEVKNEPIKLNQFQLDSPWEAQLYHSQENNIFTDELIGGRTRWTPYAGLNGKLYFKQLNGKYTEIVGANPDSFSELMNIYSSYSNLYTDSEHIIFQGQILDLDLDTFEAVRVRPARLEYDIETGFFKASDRVFYIMEGQLLDMNADAETFEVVDVNGNTSGRIYQDKDYVYKIPSKGSTEITKVPRVQRVL